MGDDRIKSGPTGLELLELLERLELPTTTDRGFEYLRIEAERGEYDPSAHLIERAHAADPTVTFVNMNDAKTTVVGPKENHDLFTIGLYGCDAALLLTHSNTRSIATLVHYDAFGTQLIPMQLAVAAESQHLDSSEGVSHSILILTPGEPSKSGEPYTLDPRNTGLKDLVHDAVQEVIGGDIPVRVVPYRMGRAGQSSALIVSWRGGDSQRISYNFGQREFGDLPIQDA